VTTVLPRKKVVLLGLMSHMPVAGVAWLTAQYLVGFERLGYDAYYVEAHGMKPSWLLVKDGGDDRSAPAAAYIAGVMRRFDLEGRWAFHALHDDSRVYGMSADRLNELYRSAALILNLHGATTPLPEHSAGGRLVYMGTDPVEREVRAFENDRQAIDLLAPHAAFFTWGLNYGRPSCLLPVLDRFRFHPSPPPVILDFWTGRAGRAEAFTTVGNWRQDRPEFRYRGEVYHWSKHHEFMKVIDLPRRTGQAFELAVSSCGEDDRAMLREQGWRVRDGLEVSTDLDVYREYVGGSRGEFTVAKDQNVRLRSGWFSERSAQYLAAGRPVVTQETGFGNVLPTGRGLFAFSTVDEAAAAVEAINADYPGHCRAAADLAREFFSHDVVLKRVLAEVGL
jgi:hypothetical protein